MPFSLLGQRLCSGIEGEEAVFNVCFRFQLFVAVSRDISPSYPWKELVILLCAAAGRTRYRIVLML